MLMREPGSRAAATLEGEERKPVLVFLASSWLLLLRPPAAVAVAAVAAVAAIAAVAALEEEVEAPWLLLALLFPPAPTPTPTTLLPPPSAATVQASACPMLPADVAAPGAP